jgi:predicted RNA-binding protein YlqC (UPF0109 family)
MKMPEEKLCKVEVEPEAETMTIETSNIRELIEYIAKSLVDNVENIEINEIAGTQTNVIELKVAKEDIGKVIGRNGRTADAIRTILNCGAAKLNKRYILHIIDE